ncbi:cupin domain-containing protein [Photobacterium leiognathi subsp. mandapamensis]|uniref:cupin domain-containing protein n=1 Tax=Photobacterium leiognathi TaxID=553611 RepID=UPI003AF38301
MQSSMEKPQNNLPNFLRGLAEESLRTEQLNFVPIEMNGRACAEVHWLFKAEQANGAAAAVIRYYPGGSAPPHLHTGYELIYMLEGEMKTSTGTVKKNDLILLEPDSIHASCSDKGCIALIIWQQAVQPLSN